MRLRLSLVVTFVLFTSSAFAIDRWIPIAGTVANFRTDTRIFNPSATKDIEISAYFLPVGNGDNSGRVNGDPVRFTVKKREQRVLDDVVTALFSTTGIGGILLRSSDDFVATSRIYATVAAGTLGQFSVAPQPNQASARGVVIQLKSSTSFRTNVGAVNPNATATTVTWRLFDKASKQVATGTTNMPPFAVIGPTNIATSNFFFSVPAGTDLSDTFITYSATQPIFAYGSIVDNGTTDQTFSPMIADSGTDLEPEQPQAITVAVMAREFEFDVTPSAPLAAGKTATFEVRSDGTVHGFALFAPNGTLLINMDPVTSTVRTQTITLPAAGRYEYVCTHVCGEGHFTMNGSFTVP